MKRSIAGFVVAAFLISGVSGCETGVVDGTGSASSAIIGGTAVNDGSWPAVGAVWLGTESMCTGTLVSPKIVVTAAHCVKGENPNKFTFGYDMNNGTDYTVAQAVYHRNYDSGSYSDPGSHDVGVLVLSKAVTGVTPAKLYSGDFTKLAGEDIVFVGYGNRDPYGAEYGLKYQVTLTIADVDAQGFWNYTNSNDPHNTCGGDSGGPGFVKNADGDWVIGGFVSSGDEYCVQDGYNMRADSNAAWINEMIETYDSGTTVTPVCGNGECETGETVQSCPADCDTNPDPIWSDCSQTGTCQDPQFCVGVSQTEAYCTITCTDVELGGGCGYEDMACLPLQDGGGACVKTGAECGDGFCWYGETAASCPADCDKECGDVTIEGCCSGSTVIYCDNGQYRSMECPSGSVCSWATDNAGDSYYWCVEGTSATEDPSGSFPMECGSVVNPDKCGNGTCDNGETTASCPADCPEDPVEPVCGDGKCESPAETVENCASDCEQVEYDCGNGVCDSAETAANCPADCQGGDTVCGNDVCENGETCGTCPKDCGECDRDVIDMDASIPSGDNGGSDAVSEDNGGNGGSGGCSAGAGNTSQPGVLIMLSLFCAFIALRRSRQRA